MKHDHKKTKKLKVALFAMVMFLPFIAIGVTCATHIFNKEVTEETETATITYKYEKNKNPNNGIELNTIYKIGPTNNKFVGQYNYLTCINKTTNQIEYEFNLFYTNNPTNWAPQPPNIYITNNQVEVIYDEFYAPFTDYDIYISFYDEEYIQENELLLQNLLITTNYNGPIESVSIETNPQDQTTNIFYDSCSQVEQSFILNWCEQANPVRGPIQSFTTAFSLPNEHIINTLITYWICIAMIYIVIDIIVECVVMITHFFNKEF